MPVTFARKALIAAVAIAAFGGLASAQSAITLKVGDKAPALSVGKWVKGEPVTGFKDGTVYVIENWATWCGPCRAVIPHVTEIQHKFKDKVVVIGQNVFENDEAKVEPFVKEMGDKMDYRVVFDTKPGQDGDMAKNWMAAAGQDGIPCSFVVDQKGMIAWIGHPGEMEPVLERVVAGTYDMETAKKEAAIAAEKAAKDRAVALKVNEKMNAIGGKLQTLVNAGDIDGAYTLLDESIKGDADLDKANVDLKFRIAMMSKNFDKFYADSDKIAATMKDDQAELNKFAWVIATSPQVAKRDLKVAAKFAERAVEITKRKDAAPLDTLARVYFDDGQIDKAIATQEEALPLVNGDKAEYEAALAKYKAAKK